MMSLNGFPTPSGVQTDPITAGPNGALFFTEPTADKIGEVTTAGVVTEFAIRPNHHQGVRHRVRAADQE
jgi:streptogramin lyase